jgi:hypothetical protein
MIAFRASGRTSGSMRSPYGRENWRATDITFPRACFLNTGHRQPGPKSGWEMELCPNDELRRSSACRETCPRLRGGGPGGRGAGAHASASVRQAAARTTHRLHGDAWTPGRWPVRAAVA